MNTTQFIARVKNILTTPKTEWPVIAGEPATVAGLYKGYIAIIALIPVAMGFIKGSLIGYGAFGITVRTSIVSGLTGAVVGYALGLALVYLMALIIDALAPTFGGQKNPVQALKTAAYAWTAAWVANIGLLVPWVGLLIVLAGGCYSIYLLYLGLTATMKCPPEKAGGYTALSFVCGFALSLILSVVVGAITSAGNAPAFDQNSWLGKMEAASKQMEAAQKSGDADAQMKASRKMVGAALGGGDQVEALAPELLKPFVPETLGGLKRTDFSAQRNGAMGVQVSEARATYSDAKGRSLQLEISDMGGMKGLMGLANQVGVESDRQTEHGYEKIYKQGGRLAHERWDTQSKNGEFGITVGERFSVKVSGGAGSIDEIKALVMHLDLAGLEALKNKGVKKD